MTDTEDSSEHVVITLGVDGAAEDGGVEAEVQGHVETVDGEPGDYEDDDDPDEEEDCLSVFPTSLIHQQSLLSPQHTSSLEHYTQLFIIKSSEYFSFIILKNIVKPDLLRDGLLRLKDTVPLSVLLLKNLLSTSLW